MGLEENREKSGCDSNFNYMFVLMSKRVPDELTNNVKDHRDKYLQQQRDQHQQEVAPSISSNFHHP